MLFRIIAVMLVVAGTANAGGFWHTDPAAEVQLQPSQYREVAPAAGPAPVRNWQGSYIGLSIGQSDAYTTYSNGFDGTSFGGDGHVFGGQVGHNWQYGALVLGVEGDFHAADGDGSDNGALGQIDRIESNWSASARARAGLAVGPVLPYVTAGWALENVDYTIEKTGKKSRSFTESDTLNGPTYGAGVEVALSDRTSARVEYRRSDLDGGQLDNASDLGTRQYEREVETLLFGLNYRFTGPAGRYY